MANDEAWGTARLYDGLIARYAPPEYGLLLDVPDGTGTQKTRSADAVAMSLWPSRGLHLIGFEVKASRSDWVREVKNPAKAEAIARHCDYWYVVAGSKAMIGPGELPPTWGLIAPKGDKLAIIKEAPLLTQAPVDRAFLAAIFRRAGEKFARLSCDSEVKAEVYAAYLRGLGEGKASAAESARREVDAAKAAYDRLRATMAEFEAAAGITISTYSGAGKIGDAVRAVMHGGMNMQLREMQSIAASARAILEASRQFEAAATARQAEDFEHALAWAGGTG